MNKLQGSVMNFLLETGSVEEAARTLRDLKPPKRYVEHTGSQCVY